MGPFYNGDSFWVYPPMAEVVVAFVRVVCSLKIPSSTGTGTAAGTGGNNMTIDDLTAEDGTDQPQNDAYSALCQELVPCKNGASCGPPRAYTASLFSCTCASGFSGLDCSVSSNANPSSASTTTIVIVIAVAVSFMTALIIGGWCYLRRRKARKVNAEYLRMTE